ncbi:uncharacterized protein LOC119165904 [Rhipicephalus microplus]|uniref:uncharacterized protein LOC119165904 n=1 Tax=Rhipicephalus microplus TaxID=6941 RepID=UPI003F6CE342
MDLQRQSYTVFGFSKELNWRPLNFVDLIPAERICNGCGLLPIETAHLPCRHVLCKPCFQQCLVNEEYECLLGCNQFTKKDVEWRAFPMKDLLEYKVKCWNQDNGCKAILSVEEMLDHFYGGCVHRSTHCPKCSASVLCKDVGAHRRSDCSTHKVPNQAKHQKPSEGYVQKAMLFLLEATLRERVEEIRICLDRLIRDLTTQCDSLSEESRIETSETETRTMNEARITRVSRSRQHFPTEVDRGDQVSERIDDLSIEVSQGVSALSEHIKILQGDTRRSSENMEQSNIEIKRHLSSADDRLEGVLKTMKFLKGVLGESMKRVTNNGGQVSPNMADTILLGQNTLNITCYEFRVKGLNELKKAVTSETWAVQQKDPVYLRGYRIAPGLYLRKHGDSVAVHLLIQLYKGVVDEFLQWPYCHDIQITFMQSSSDRRREFPNRTRRHLESFLRPTELCNRARYYTSFVLLDDLERDGFTEGNELCVMWELLPRTSE